MGKIRHLSSINLAENQKYIITIVSLPQGMSIKYIHIQQQQTRTLAWIMQQRVLLCKNKPAEFVLQNEVQCEKKQFPACNLLLASNEA